MVASPAPRGDGRRHVIWWRLPLPGGRETPRYMVAPLVPRGTGNTTLYGGVTRSPGNGRRHGSALAEVTTTSSGTARPHPTAVGKEWKRAGGGGGMNT
eukprot:gene12856-biopygen4363